MQSIHEMSRDDIVTAVTHCLYSYARAVDRCDWEGVRAVYHPDAFDHHGAYQGGVDGLIEDMKTRHAHLDSSMHAITNVIVEVPEPDTAMAESYCLCWLRRRDRDEQGRQEVTAVRSRYLDRITPDESGTWRIASRMVVFDETRVDLITDVTAAGSAAAARDDHDPLWTFRRAGASWRSQDYATR